MIDALPVPVVGFAHAYGYNATKKQTIYGFKLHLLATHPGLILDFALAPANIVDAALSAQLLEDHAGLSVLGDKAYLNAALQGRLRREHAVDLFAPTTADARAPVPAPLVRLIAHFRQATETLNGQLVGQCNVERSRAKCLSGLCARIRAKLTSHTLGIALNQDAGRPLLALI